MLPLSGPRSSVGVTFLSYFVEYEHKYRQPHARAITIGFRKWWEPETIELNIRGTYNLVQ